MNTRRKIIVKHYFLWMPFKRVSVYRSLVFRLHVVLGEGKTGKMVPSVVSGLGNECCLERWAVWL